MTYPGGPSHYVTKQAKTDQLVNQTGALIRFEFFDETTKGAASTWNKFETIGFFSGDQKPNQFTRPEWKTTTTFLVANATVLRNEDYHIIQAVPMKKKKQTNSPVNIESHKNK